MGTVEIFKAKRTNSYTCAKARVVPGVSANCFWVLRHICGYGEETRTVFGRQERGGWCRCKCLFYMLLAASIVIGGAGTAFAVTSSSNSYRLDESQFNAGTSQENCSDQFCARTSIGNLAVGDSEGSTSTATFGSVTPDEPMLEVIVDPGESNLGVLTTSATASKTMIVRIRNYLSDGYTLQITGNPPKYAGHTLATPSSPTAAAPGTEQFALNAADNSTPDIGAIPQQVPSGGFSFGQVENDYDNSNLFKYTSGDVVARSLSSSGRTDYTISMIVNISNSTPAGHYTGDFSAVVIPIY